jgi:hypothetical protein
MYVFVSGNCFVYIYQSQANLQGKPDKTYIYQLKLDGDCLFHDAGLCFYSALLLATL